jgi:TfoX/Sxy family transcriptional regulator of competence genes
MAYDEKLANRIREGFENVPKVKEKEMMGGLCFMVNDKMCVGIFRGELMCRVDPMKSELLEKRGATRMEMGGKKMNGFLIISDEGIKSKRNFDFWIAESLAFNKFAKASKKKKKPAKKATKKK